MSRAVALLLAATAAAAIAHAAAGRGPAAGAAPPRVSIFDLKVDEGDAGTTNATFNVRLSAATDQTVTVDYSTTDIVAKAPDDYQAASGTLTFAPGQTLQQVTVAINGDTLDENDEVFDVILANPTNAILGRVRGRATIVDNDAEPMLSIADAAVTAMVAHFAITLSAPSGRAVSVAFATADETAKAGSDYRPISGRVAFRPGETSASVTVPIIPDTIDEDDETFSVNLSNPLNATIADGQGSATIVDDDPPPSAAIDDITLKEGTGGTRKATFTVMLSSPSGRTITIDYATIDGTATAPADYESASGTLTIPPGQPSGKIVVEVVADTEVEFAESFTVELTNPVNVTIDDNRAQATIENDDVVPPPKPGVSVNIEPEVGTILVQLPGTLKFVPLDSLESIPIGSTIDATRGRVGMKSSGGKVDFYSGIFLVRSEQRVGARRITEVWLKGGNFAACPKSKRRTRRPAAVPRPKVIRRLWGNGKGGFRTRGRVSSATIRGTIWLTEDRCDGTLTRVVRGAVTVLDLKRNRKVVVRAGQSYLAAR